MPKNEISGYCGLAMTGFAECSLTMKCYPLRKHRQVLMNWLAECSDITVISGRVRPQDEELYLRIERVEPSSSF